MSRLWLCLCLPSLPLEILPGDPAAAAVPCAVFEEDAQRTRILACNGPATARGIRPGMPVNSALALAPDGEFHLRNTGLERAALIRLADRAGHFTPTVSIEPPEALLLEVRGSLKLFGGHDKLRERVSSGFRSRGHATIAAVAPTARAALWLARAGIERAVCEIAGLPGVLGPVPVEFLGWPARSMGMLAEMGVTTLGDCIRLPRQGLARRLGPDRLRELDQAYGKIPEVRAVHVPPTRFRTSIELPLETADSGLLLEGFRLLLAELDACLVSRQASVRVLWLRLVHTHGQDAWLPIGLRRAASSTGLLFHLARTRIEAHTLPAPIASLALEAELVDGRGEGDADLLGDELAADGRLPELLERLRGRLGGQAVHGLGLVADHRPERAWRTVEDPFDPDAPRDDPCIAGRSRPLWILALPRAFAGVAGETACPGILTLERGPERIETGWWDGDDVRRDYYVARNRQGNRLWVFRDLRSSRWYLHGVFP